MRENSFALFPEILPLEWTFCLTQIYLLLWSVETICGLPTASLPAMMAAEKGEAACFRHSLLFAGGRERPYCKFSLVEYCVSAREKGFFFFF